MSGWIKLHRKILENPVLQDDLNFTVFVRRLLLRVTHKPYKIERRGHELTLQPGQVCVSVRSLAEQSNVGRQVMRRVLDLFENRSMIRTRSNPLGTIVTICNWEKYQVEENPGNPAPTQQPTQHQPSTNPHNKNNKKEKKESTDSESPPETYGQLSLTGDDPDPEEHDRFDEWWSCWAIPGTKRDKKTARSKYAGIVKREEATQQQLIDGLKAYMVYCHGMEFGPDKIKHPDRWLNAGAWANEHVVTNTGGSANGKLDPRAMAERLAAELAGSDGTANQAHGVRPSHQPDSQGRSGSSNRTDGQGLPEIPAWFDQEGG